MSQGKIAAAVQAGRVLVSDGAWGTFLQKKGLKNGECPELWCLDRPQDVLEVAAGYVDAGADMIESDSFGATRLKLRPFGLSSRAAEINRAAAAISRKAAGSKAWVIASMGPTGHLLIDEEEGMEAEMFEGFREQALALEQGGADALCIETMSALDESALAIRAAREASGCEVICTFTFNRTPQGGYRTMMGVSPAAAARAALDAGAHIIGTNCGNGIKGMIDIVREMREAAPDAPILVHANAGLPVAVNGVVSFPETPDQMAAEVPALIAAGADIIGGCCGTSPAHIAAIRKAVRTAASAKRQPHP